jgi:N-acetylmuramic acid 6-phosphate (MurNAc-6-P) etherase
MSKPLRAHQRSTMLMMKKGKSYHKLMLNLSKPHRADQKSAVFIMKNRVR